MDWENRIVPFEIDGKTLEMVLTTAALIKIEQRFGGLEALGKALSSENALESSLWLAATLAKQGHILRTGNARMAEECPDLDWIAINLPPLQISALTEAAMRAINIGLSSEHERTDENAEIDVVLEEIKHEKNAAGAGSN